MLTCWAMNIKTFWYSSLYWSPEMKIGRRNFNSSHHIDLRRRNLSPRWEPSFSYISPSWFHTNQCFPRIWSRSFCHLFFTEKPCVFRVSYVRDKQILKRFYNFRNLLIINIHSDQICFYFSFWSWGDHFSVRYWNL